MRKKNTAYSKLDTGFILFVIIILLIDDVFNITGLKNIILFENLNAMFPGFDAYRFALWFLLPFTCSFFKIDWYYWGFNNWKKKDLILIIFFIFLFIFVIYMINVIPGLREYYPSKKSLVITNWDYISKKLLFLFSWILGWEFIFRYLLVRSLTVNWPKRGWIVIPIIESLYHFTKHPLEAIGMFVFSIILTKLAINKKNCLLSALIHLILEIELIMFLMLC